MPQTNFLKLEVYLLAERLADEVWKIVVDWKPFARNTVGIQLVDAADSGFLTQPQFRLSFRALARNLAGTNRSADAYLRDLSLRTHT